MKKLLTALITGILVFLGFATLSSCATGGRVVLEDGTELFSLKAGVEILGFDLQDSYWDYLDTVLEDEEDLQPKRLAVLTFVNEKGKKTDVSRDIANSLQVSIHEPELFVLLERERIDSLLEEYRFSNTGMVEELSGAELGKLLGAELVVVGTVTQKEYTTVISKIVDLQTGEVRAIGEINLKDLPPAVELD